MVILMSASGCVTPETVTTVYNADRVSADRLAEEGTIVFVRPTDYNVFGTESIRDYVEVTYEQASRNDAGFLKLNLGLRNRCGQRFYDTGGPSFHLSVKTAFYDRPLASGTPQSAPLYETNWQKIKLIRGATEHYQVICPVAVAGYYQVTISESLQ
jgi:hypothetical protein